MNKQKILDLMTRLATASANRAVGALKYAINERSSALKALKEDPLVTPGSLSWVEKQETYDTVVEWVEFYVEEANAAAQSIHGQSLKVAEESVNRAANAAVSAWISAISIKQ